MTLILENLTHAYGQTKTLQGVSLNVEKGEVVSLLGPSGCGKTTLLRLVAGLEHLKSGRIELDGQLLATEGHHPPPETRPVGLVFQEHALFPGMNVAENIMFGLKKLPAAKRQERCRELLNMVGLAGFERRKPGALSGGQQQRVALARALAPAPSVMLLDEPYASVDVMLKREMREAARLLLKQAGSASILVTHDPEEALEMSDRIAIMSDGRILQVGTPEDIIEQPLAPDVAHLFGEAQMLDGEIDGDFLNTPIGRFRIPGGSSESMKGKLYDLVVRPTGLSYHADPDGEWIVRDLRYSSTGRILYLTGANTDSLSVVRVSTGFGAPPVVGERGHIDLLDRHAFLFAKKSH